MKALLIQPVPPMTRWPIGSFRSRWIPSGLAAIAAALRQAGVEVRVHLREEQLIRNGFDWPAAEAALRELLQAERPDLLGLSVVTPAVPETAAIAAMARELLGAGVRIVAGGPHPTALPARTLADCPDLDAVVIGEGEGTIVELIRRAPCDEIAGIAFRRDGRVIETAPRSPPGDLDALPATPYDLFDMAFHAEPNRYMVRWLDVRAINLRTSRGCTGRCRFCAGHLVCGLGVRPRNVEAVADDVAQAVERFGVEAVHFEDDSLGADRARLMDLCGVLRRRGLHRRVVWDGCLRVDQADEELLREMRSAGCIQVEYGFESGSDSALRRLGKNVTSDMNRRAVELTRRCGLRVFADIMVGLPGETADDFARTMDFLRWARPEVISAGRLCPLPGTGIYEQLPEEVKQRLDWGGYAYFDQPGFLLNLTAMPDDQFETLYRGFLRYAVLPATMDSFLRDTLRDNPAERRHLRRRLRRFMMRHPVRALRAPWRRS